MTSDTPCYGCQLRQIGCHGSCDKYKAFNLECIEIRQTRANKAISLTSDVEFSKRLNQAQGRRDRRARA